MPTAGRFNIYRKLGPDAAVIVLNIDPAVAINEGDLLYFDKADGRAKPITTDAHAEFYCGVALATNPVAHHPKPITKMAVFVGDIIAKLNMPAGEAITWKTPVFANGNPTSVTIDDAAGAKVNPLGYVVIDAEEFKTPRNVAAGEEVSILMKQSIFLTRAF